MHTREAYFSSLSTAKSAEGAAHPQGIRSVQKGSQNYADISFGDFLDLINPLQHIPLVSNLYQNATGDKISPVASMIGGAILGGSLGFAMAGIHAVFEEATGKNLFESVLNPTPTTPDYTKRYHRIANAHKPDGHLFA